MAIDINAQIGFSIGLGRQHRRASVRQVDGSGQRRGICGCLQHGACAESVGRIDCQSGDADEQHEPEQAHDRSAATFVSTEATHTHGIHCRPQAYGFHLFYKIQALGVCVEKFQFR
jgi:hypothetical protein